MHRHEIPFRSCCLQIIETRLFSLARSLRSCTLRHVPVVTERIRQFCQPESFSLPVEVVTVSEVETLQIAPTVNCSSFLSRARERAVDFFFFGGCFLRLVLRFFLRGIVSCTFRAFRANKKKTQKNPGGYAVAVACTGNPITIPTVITVSEPRINDMFP